MRYCPITYEVLAADQIYSVSGLRLLSPKLRKLLPLQYNTNELRIQALALQGKMSIQGIQLKLSAKLNITDGQFEIVEQHGQYILKPQSDLYQELPENEAISMTMAAMLGLEVPVHGLIYNQDKTMTYFIKRFDRQSARIKIPVEDFAQLSVSTRDTKYNSSMEEVIKIIQKFCSFPKVEAKKIFLLSIFNFLIGNEDMHLKNFSLITRDNVTTLAPVYDLLNTTIVLHKANEEIALPLNGKKNNLRKSDFVQYFALERLGLSQQLVNKMFNDIQQLIPKWQSLLQISFLSPSMRQRYLDLLANRCQRLGLIE